MSDILTVGVIGLGNAGSPILNNLYKSKKYNLIAFDIDKNKLNDVSEDITKAKQNEHMFENESKVFNLDNKSHNSGLIMSFFLLHIGEYIEKYRLADR